ncbi:hypothetical protein EDEG_01782 [Edhazardia aedis USNM 41457]|uniref:Uncharacterized protein n=1 Tax=Edhazardia aedis (strain USNM 41457) TaxID=1003232 RepID=J9D808_EDHAE|nr:hypothetical protein EDEG_01782 [Edhazardia aedis USNM 41457]|eukprot:EJW03926.1 hypothetical protein EDEG_01782 [Edhazardia aedis USNM 41457]
MLQCILFLNSILASGTLKDMFGQKLKIKPSLSPNLSLAFNPETSEFMFLSIRSRSEKRLDSTTIKPKNDNTVSISINDALLSLSSDSERLTACPSKDDTWLIKYVGGGNNLIQHPLLSDKFDNLTPICLFFPGNIYDYPGMKPCNENDPQQLFKIVNNFNKSAICLVYHGDHDEESDDNSSDYICNELKDEKKKNIAKIAKKLKTEKEESTIDENDESSSESITCKVKAKSRRKNNVGKEFSDDSNYSNSSSYNDEEKDITKDKPRKNGRRKKITMILM